MCSSVSPASPSSIPLLSITRLEPCVCKSWIVKLRDMSSGLLNWKRRKIISLKCLPYGNFFQNGAQPCSYHRFYKREFLQTIYSHYAGGKENLCDKNEVDENLLLLNGLLVFLFPVMLSWNTLFRNCIKITAVRGTVDVRDFSFSSRLHMLGVNSNTLVLPYL